MRYLGARAEVGGESQGLVEDRSTDDVTGIKEKTSSF
jgi:hypothetical protein